MNQRTFRKRKRAGFTLMEVLLVLAILVVMASMAVLGYRQIQQSAYSDTARSEMKTFQQAIGFYQLHTNRYPTKLESLIRRPSDLPNPEKWQGPYLEVTEVPSDPWGNEYVYTVTGNEYFEIVCFGADMTQGGDDDVVITNKPLNQ